MTPGAPRPTPPPLRHLESPPKSCRLRRRCRCYPSAVANTSFSHRTSTITSACLFACCFHLQLPAPIGRYMPPFAIASADARCLPMARVIFVDVESFSAPSPTKPIMLSIRELPPYPSNYSIGGPTPTSASLPTRRIAVVLSWRLR